MAKEGALRRACTVIPALAAAALALSACSTPASAPETAGGPGPASADPSKALVSAMASAAAASASAASIGKKTEASCDSEPPLVPIGTTKIIKLDGYDNIVTGEPCFDLTVLAAEKSALGLHQDMNDVLCQQIGADQFGVVMGHGTVDGGYANDMANDSKIPAEVGTCGFANNPKQPDNQVQVKYEKTADPTRVFTYVVNQLKGYGAVVKQVDGLAENAVTYRISERAQGYLVDDGMGNTAYVTVTSDKMMPFVPSVAKKALEVAAALD